MIITPQYCAGWVRQLENMILAVPAEVAEKLPERARELIGYSIHPPFMGHVDGVHPKRLLRSQARARTPTNSEAHLIEPCPPHVRPAFSFERMASRTDDMGKCRFVSVGRIV